MTASPHNTPDISFALFRAGLDEGIEAVRNRLRALADGKPMPAFAAPTGSAIPLLASIFHLSAAEQELLLLATAAELDPATAESIDTLTGSKICDIALAQRVIGPALWDAIVPEAPLRHWRLIELSGRGALQNSSIRVDERILQALLGNTYLDERLKGFIRMVWPEDTTSTREAALKEQIVSAWSNKDALKLPFILISGADTLSKRNIAAAAVHQLGLTLYRLAHSDIPTDHDQRTALATYLDRELALSNAALLIEGASGSVPFADLVSGPTILSAVDPDIPEREPVLRLELHSANRAERRDQWQSLLGPRADVLGPALERIASQFALNPSAIKAAIAELRPDRTEQDTATQLWQSARKQGRRSLDGLADRIESRATWADLILPDDQLAILHDLSGHIRDAWIVNNNWGWSDKSSRGLGAAALFAGPSGTGKTLAAEVLAGELQLDLYRIDLSQIVSKYIGETEKNLARIFSAAEDGGAILLFDEADALFGKRSEVKDSHDRYANVEVSYLLQRMEAYSGLAILTTNQKSAIDTAFLRRLRYVLNFPFPDFQARADIWMRIFPDATPCDGVSPQALARLNVAGGSIRSIALNAAYLAAQSPEPVRMEHLLRAARREYSKLEKPFTNAEREAFR